MRKIYRIISIVLSIMIVIQLSPLEMVKASTTDPYIGEIRLFAGNFAPRGWAFCHGQLLPISQYSALFSLLGTTYGGDGRTTFALPDLRGRVPIGEGSGPGLTSRRLGVKLGEESVTLNNSQLPSHNHGNVDLDIEVNATGSVLGSNTTGDKSIPGNTVVTKGIRNERIYSSNDGASIVEMMKDAFSINESINIEIDTNSSGNNSAHNNMSPALTLNYIIALNGVYPSRDGGSAVDPILGEIKMFAFNFAPGGFAKCEGQLFQISQYDALFSLLGTIYGGDGETTFGLPDLRGRMPIGSGNGPGLSNYGVGHGEGKETVALSENEMPSHSHNVVKQTVNIPKRENLPISTNRGNSAVPEGNVLAVGSRNERIYTTAGSDTMMKDSSVHFEFDDVPDITRLTSQEGVGQSHNNMMPSLGINYAIALQGLYPSQGGGSTDEYIGMINMFAFNFAPSGYANCEGQLLPINNYQSLFSILGTTYGGDGRTTLGLPELRGRVPIGEGTGPGLSTRRLGAKIGEESVALTTAQMPTHNHKIPVNPVLTGSGILLGTNDIGNSDSPSDAIFARGLRNERIYSSVANDVMANAVNINLDVTVTPKDSEVSSIDGNGVHENRQPYLTITYAIALNGVFPPRN